MCSYLWASEYWFLTHGRLNICNEESKQNFLYLLSHVWLLDVRVLKALYVTVSLKDTVHAIHCSRIILSVKLNDISSLHYTRRYRGIAMPASRTLPTRVLSQASLWPDKPARVFDATKGYRGKILSNFSIRCVYM